MNKNIGTPTSNNSSFIDSPFDAKLKKSLDHPDVAVMTQILAMAQASLCPPKYAKFCSGYNEFIKIRRLPLEKL